MLNFILCILCITLSLLLIKANKNYQELWKAGIEDNRKVQKMINTYENRICELKKRIRELEDEKEGGIDAG